MYNKSKWQINPIHYGQRAIKEQRGSESFHSVVWLEESSIYRVRHLNLNHASIITSYFPDPESIYIFTK